MGAKWPTGFDHMAERRDHLTRQAACLIWMLSAIAPSCGAVEAESGGYYAPSQAKAGAEIYAGHCASCHGAALEGAAAPALSGDAFAHRWQNGQRKVGDLLHRIDSTMPLGAPHTLSREEYADVTAYVLSRNGYPAGGTGLGEESGLVSLAGDSKATSHLRIELPKVVFADRADGIHPADAELRERPSENWLMYNGDYAGDRFSSLTQITPRNAHRLQAVCAFQAGEIGNFQSAPVIFDGLLYFTTPYNTFALDPLTCAKRWEHRYPEDKAVTLALSRGAALYRGKVFRSTPNGHLLALDAKSGRLAWDVWLANKDEGYWLSAAPIAYDGMVFMGTAGADWGTPGRLYGFDAEDGHLIWTFHTIPTGHEVGAETWPATGQWGGASFWTTFALDAHHSLLFASLGNPAPDYNGDSRPGDNLFSNSVVALDAHTGQIAWWVQQRPHDTHDWDTAAAPVLYDSKAGPRMAVASKDGWLYVYDRERPTLIQRLEISPHVNAEVPLSTQAEVYHCPGISGGAVWNGPAFSRRDDLLIVNSVHWCGKTRLTDQTFMEGSSFFGGEHTWDPPKSARGFTRAFDASSGKEKWVREFPAPMLAAVTPTAGGVTFTGTLSGEFLALDTATGRTLYSFNTGGAVAGAPSTYEIDHRQLVAIATGNTSRVHWMTGGSMTLMIFALPKGQSGS